MIGGLGDHYTYFILCEVVVILFLLGPETILFLFIFSPETSQFFFRQSFLFSIILFLNNIVHLVDYGRDLTQLSIGCSYIHRSCLVIPIDVVNHGLLEVAVGCIHEGVRLLHEGGGHFNRRRFVAWLHELGHLEKANV